MTYSIVARDPATGDLGVGVQTHQVGVGAIVPWVKPGVGAVATQSSANVAFGPQALALLESGLDAEHALAAILAGDRHPERRQVAVLDVSGKAAVYTGEACIPFAGHQVGEGYSVQANMMLNDTVPAAMARAFEASEGHLSARILAALEAAQGEGGDIRGSQSAAIVVHAPGNGLDYQWDLRVDNDPQPLVRLRELVHLRLAGRRLSVRAGDEPPSLQEAFAAFAEAEQLFRSDEQTFWFAVNVIGDRYGELDRAAELLAPLFQRAPQWRELMHRLPGRPAGGLLERFPR